MPPEDEDREPDEPRRAERARRPREDRRDEYDDDYDDRPRRRRRQDDDYEDGDATGGLIPYKNGMALAGYYCGVVGLIPVLGLILGILAIIFGIVGLRHKSRHPAHGGTAHAIVGIVLGSLAAIGNWTVAILILIGSFR